LLTIVSRPKGRINPTGTILAFTQGWERRVSPGWHNKDNPDRQNFPFKQWWANTA